MCMDCTTSVVVVVVIVYFLGRFISHLLLLIMANLLWIYARIMYHIKFSPPPPNSLPFSVILNKFISWADTSSCHSVFPNLLHSHWGTLTHTHASVFNYSGDVVGWKGKLFPIPTGAELYQVHCSMKLIHEPLRILKALFNNFSL